MTWCYHCKEYRPDSDFPKDRSRPCGLSHRCRKCNTIHQAKMMANRRVREGEGYRIRQRKYELMRYYGLTEKQYEDMFIKQKGVCAICGMSPKKNGWLAVDHCHDTGYFRGLLCRRCNSAIGLLDDNCEKVQSAANYLRRTSVDVEFKIVRGRTP